MWKTVWTSPILPAWITVYCAPHLHPFHQPTTASSLPLLSIPCWHFTHKSMTSQLHKQLNETKPKKNDTTHLLQFLKAKQWRERGREVREEGREGGREGGKWGGRSWLLTAFSGLLPMNEKSWSRSRTWAGFSRSSSSLRLWCIKTPDFFNECLGLTIDRRTMQPILLTTFQRFQDFYQHSFTIQNHSFMSTSPSSLPSLLHSICPFTVPRT